MTNLVDEKQRKEIKRKIGFSIAVRESDLTKYIFTGDFKMLAMNHPQFMLQRISKFLPVVYKELKRYDEAITLFKMYINMTGFYYSKVEIGCCEILKGNIEKGLQIVHECEKNHYLYLQVGLSLIHI